ncbi:MAG TPA: hypothetical protein VHC47_09685 [Mucilaginibacter sp.]|nr:hypothetical protein [Mucilaginibacter sp.]
MKKTACLIIMLACTALVSCNHNCCDLPTPVNTMKATKNGAAWELNYATGNMRQDTLILADTSVNPERTELILFKFKFDGTGNYKLSAGNLVYAYAHRMDNPYVYYTLNTAYNNSLKITGYDTGGGIVTGTFNIKLDKDPSNNDSRYPANLSFLNGVFNIHLSK